MPCPRSPHRLSWHPFPSDFPDTPVSDPQRPPWCLGHSGFPPVISTQFIMSMTALSGTWPDRDTLSSDTLHRSSPSPNEIISTFKAFHKPATAHTDHVQVFFSLAPWTFSMTSSHCALLMLILLPRTPSHHYSYINPTFSNSSSKATSFIPTHPSQKRLLPLFILLKP